MELIGLLSDLTGRSGWRACVAALFRLALLVAVVAFSLSRYPQWREELLALFEQFRSHFVR